MNSRSCARWEDFFHIGRMLEVDLKLPNVHFQKKLPLFFCCLNRKNRPVSHQTETLNLTGTQKLVRCDNKKTRPTNSVIYGTLRYTLQAIRCCASYTSIFF